MNKRILYAIPAILLVVGCGTTGTTTNSIPNPKTKNNTTSLSTNNNTSSLSNTSNSSQTGYTMAVTDPLIMASFQVSQNALNLCESFSNGTATLENLQKALFSASVLADKTANQQYSLQNYSGPQIYLVEMNANPQTGNIGVQLWCNFVGTKAQMQQLASWSTYFSFSLDKELFYSTSEEALTGFKLPGYKPSQVVFTFGKNYTKPTFQIVYIPNTGTTVINGLDPYTGKTIDYSEETFKESKLSRDVYADIGMF